MPKLIIVSFLFMGFVFYELSGGADFEPRGTRPQPEDRIAKAEPKEPTTNRQNRAGDIVAKQVIAPRSTTAGLAGNGENDLTAGDEGTNALMRVAAGYNTSFTGDGDPMKTITLASLGRNTTSFQVIRDTPMRNSQTATPAAAEYVSPEGARTAELERDIREITGTRVNMRMGPGTTYPVISRVSLGDEVEVLESPGNGWLRLRVLPERTVGWISASLVGDKAD